MNKIILLVILLCTFNSLSQEKNTVPNYSFIKLIVTNANGDIALVKWGNDWEIQGKKFVGDYGVKAFVKMMANNIGVKVKNIQLRGLFTFHYKGYTIPTLMHYYQAEYVSGKLKVPPGCNNITWVSYEKALSIIAYDDMIAIIKQMHNNNNVWGGALEIIEKTKDSPREFSFKTGFYRF